MMRAKLYAAMLAAVICAAPSAEVKAGGMAVFDAGNFAKAAEQITAMAEQLNELKTQTDQLRQSLGAIRGARGMGGLLNGLTDMADRSVASAAMGDLEALVSSGGDFSPSAGAVGDRIAALRRRLDLQSGAALTPDAPDSQTAQRHDFRQGAALNAAAVAAEAFDRAPGRIALIEGLIGAIDGAADLKASVDLSNRIAAENALLLAQLIQLQSVQLRLAGAVAQSELATREHGARRALGATRADFQNLFD